MTEASTPRAALTEQLHKQFIMSWFLGAHNFFKKKPHGFA